MADLERLKAAGIFVTPVGGKWTCSGPPYAKRYDTRELAMTAAEEELERRTTAAQKLLERF